MSDKFNEWLFWGLSSTWLGFGIWIILVTNEIRNTNILEWYIMRMRRIHAVQLAREFQRLDNRNKKEVQKKKGLLTWFVKQK